MAKRQFDTDVFVFGGGPAGLAAAIAARRRGLRVILADLVRPPIDKACGESLMPDALAKLAELGISLDECERGMFRGIRFVGRANSVYADFPHGRAVGVRRTTLHRALVDHARRSGVELMWGSRVDAIAPNSVSVNGHPITTRWIVGADGQQSLIRSWAGLDAGRKLERRVALRRHFRVPFLAEYAEIYWGDDSQAYVTPVAADEVCVGVISRRKLSSFDVELERIPGLAERLSQARATSPVRGGLSVSRRLRRVCRDNIALVGDASGSVDAITGEGLALSFRHALSLADAMVRDDLSGYQADHRGIQALPQFMRATMLLMDKSATLRRRALQALEAKPALFARMLSLHVGELPLTKFGVHHLAQFGWELLRA